MIRRIPIHYLKEDCAIEAEVVHLTPTSDRWAKLNGFDAHIDDCFTVVAVSQGYGTTEIDFRTVKLSAGQLGIIAPGQVHSNIIVEDCEAWMLRLSPEMMDTEYRALIDEYSIADEAVSLTEETMEMLCYAMRLLEQLTKRADSRRHMKTAVFSMLNVILGIITPELAGARSAALPRATELSVRFKRLLPQFVRQEKRPSFYANMLCISEVYLNEVVKKTTGMTPSRWIRHAIILESKRLLRTSTLSAKEVAQELGFEDHAYFSRLFKKQTGMSPLEFRKVTLE